MNSEDFFHKSSIKRNKNDYKYSYKNIIFHIKSTILTLKLITIILILSGSSSFANEITVAAYKSVNVNSEKFFSNKNIYVINRSSANNKIDSFFDFAENKLITSGYKIEDKLSQNRLTIIQKELLPAQYRMSPKDFPVNNSIDIMLCHDPIYPNNGTGYISYRCDHVVFEFNIVNNIDTKNLYNALWKILLNSQQSSQNGTSAFSDVEYHQVFTNIKL